MGGWLFPSEDVSTRHPGDARHWAAAYAEMLRSLPPALGAPGLRGHLGERLEWWEDRLRSLESDAPRLASTYVPAHRVRVRARPRVDSPA